MPVEQAPAPRNNSEGSVKETLESILVAFILAFIFRAFVVEAFVLPTGSMAPTLLGARTRFTCDDCGVLPELRIQNTPQSSPRAGSSLWGSHPGAEVPLLVPGSGEVGRRR